MANRSQPNAQNSELDPKAHPSGARIEKMMNDQKNQSSSSQSDGEKGLYGETLRPSEREDSYVPTQDKPEGNRSQTGDNHRRSPGTREQ